MEYACVSTCLNEIDVELHQLASLLSVLLEHVGQIGDRVDPREAADVACDLTAIAHERVLQALARISKATELGSAAA
jgi:hypothetical protein